MWSKVDQQNGLTIPAWCSKVVKFSPGIDQQNIVTIPEGAFKLDQI